MAQSKFKTRQIESSTGPGAFLTTDSSNIPVFIVPSSGADRIPFYDDSATGAAFLTLGTNLSITGTTLNATAGAGGYSTIQEEGSGLTARSTLNFIGGGFTAADDAGNSRTNITLDATLNALAAYNTNGILVQTAADTFAGRALTAPAAGFTITNNDGVSGNPTFVLANDLAALEALSSTGIAVRTASDTWAQRSIVGTAGRVTVSDGNGVAGNPTINIDSNVAFKNTDDTIAGNWTFTNNVVLNGTPSLSSHAVNKGYVDALLQGISWKNSVDVATTANITLSGEQTIDGVSTSSSRVLVKNQSTTSANGIYVSGAGAWTRATDMDVWAEVPSAAVFVERGTTQADTAWVCTSDDGGTLGSTAITFVKFSSASGSIDGSGATNKVAYWSDTDTLTSTTNFHFSGTQLALGTATPVSSTMFTTQGTGTGNTTYGYTHNNSSGTNAFRVADDGTLTVGTSSPLTIEAIGLSRSGAISITPSSGNALNLFSGNGGTVNYGNGFSWTAASGTLNAMRNASLVSLSSASTATFTALAIETSITQTGGANGITRGLYINPSLTTPADYRGVEINVAAAQYALFVNSGKTRINVGSDASWDLPVRNASGDLTRIANGTTGQVLTATTGSAPTWQTPAGGVTITLAYVEGSTSSTIDLDANSGVVKDKDGNNVAFTVPTDTTKFEVYRNGQRLAETGSLTTRDYSVNTTTHVLTLATALATDEILVVVKYT
jgi:hypothetical protein